MEDSKDMKETSAPVEETPSRSKDLSKTLPEEAFNNFLQGKRHIVVQDYKFAVQSLSTACEMYVKHFGEMALECAEVYFLYGKALFRLSQQQVEVLGGALNDEGTEDEEQEKSSEEDNKENESEKNDSDTENGEENPEEENGEAAEGEEEKEPSESTDSPQATDETSKEATEKEPEATSTTDADKSLALDESKTEEKPTQEEEELEDLELAWDNLETAKSIFLKQGENDVESQLKVAEILQLLAEISMESDNNAQAIADLKECLVIQRRHLKPDHRRLAETYYHMGLAQMLDKKYNEALENFSTTMSILQMKIDNLRSTPVADTVGNFESADRAKEIEDLESVLQDIREKVEDTKELIQDAEKVIKETMEKKLKEAEEVGFASEEKAETTNKPVTNINHLLKRKKPDQDEEDNKSKRIKLTSGVQTNGIS